MRNFVRPILAASPLVFAVPAFAASIQYDDTITNANGQSVTAPQNVSASKPLPVAGTFSASLAGFTPTAGATASLSASGTSADVALPAGTDVVVTSPASNTVPVFVRIQPGAGTAVTTDMPILPGAAVGFHVGTATHLSGITAGTAATLQIQGGSGLATGYGGGGSGGGSSNNSVSNTAAAVPSQATYAGMNVGGNLTGMTGTANGLKVDPSAVTQPVSAASLPLPIGAATATNQTNVTGTVAAGAAASNSTLTGCIYNSTEPSPTTGQGLANQCDSKGRQRQVIMDAAGNTRGANVTASNALVVDGSAVTQPVSAASLPLPTGAATAANQVTNAAQGSTTSGQTGPLAQGAVTTSAPTYTTAQTDPLSLTTNGALRVLDNNSAALLTAAQAGTGSTGSAVPSSAIYSGANSGGNLTGIIQADTSTPINISTATTTQLVALVSGKKIYVTAWDVVAAGTGNITLEYGTGSNCGTGTTVLTGAYNLTAQAGITKGGGLGPVLVVPASNALCAVTSAAVQMSGSVAYTQF